MKALSLAAIAATILVLPGSLLPAYSYADTDIEITPQAQASDPNKLAIVIGPEAYQQAKRKAGADNWITIDLSAGVFSGIRLAVLPYHDDRISIALEGFAGTAVLSQAYGGGARVQIRVAANESDAFMISPGVDVYVSPHDPGFLIGHTGTIIYAVANADIGWVHQWSGTTAFELGMRLGGGFATNSAEIGFMPMPEVELYTGVRF
jgi:hypothetical protein